MNPYGCDIVGYTRDELLGMSVADLAPEREDIEQIASFGTLGEDGEMRTEETLLRKDGTQTHVLIDAVSLESDGHVAYVQEISEHKKHERRVEQQRDNLEMLNQVLRHDIRNDLQMVTAYADLLADKCENDEEKEYIAKINNNADHAVELTETAREIADVLLSSTTEQQRIGLQSTLQKEVSEVQFSYSNAALTYETTIPAATVYANEMVSSVFRNLLKNAIQHNDKPIAEVTVSATEQDESVTIRIADNGPGVPDDQKEAIFGKGNRDLKSAGTGIGLYLVDSLVTNYSGDVWVEDNTPEGSIFVVELPKAD